MNIESVDPRTGETVGVVAEETTPKELDDACQVAAAAAAPLERMGRAGRAAMLGAFADALEAHDEEIVRVSDRETALGVDRLAGELVRTCYQLRFFAEVLTDGGYVEATIDHVAATAMGPSPDLRRMLVPVGPVAVFGASNFPLAFSVPGGDTAAALAAGCPVIVKAHASHPDTSRLVSELLIETSVAVGAPKGVLQLAHGLEAGVRLVANPAIKAVGFTGSIKGGEALLRVINSRPDPIPFYGELGSLNPVVITPDAAARRATEIGKGLVASVGLGAGQFCTKPGLVLIPRDDSGDEVVAVMAEAVDGSEPRWLLNGQIAASYLEETTRLLERDEVHVLGSGREGRGLGFEATPLLLDIDVKDLSPQVAHEVFGPVTIVARYDDVSELMAALRTLPPSLTATIHCDGSQDQLLEPLVHALRERAGRLVFNSYPTGVAVSWAQHHGGPWPSTNSLHTSVGATAIRRFLRPVAYQSAPEPALPEELRDHGPAIPRRVDGKMAAPAT